MASPEHIADVINRRLSQGHVTPEQVAAVTPSCDCLANRPPTLRHVVTVEHVCVMQCPSCHKVRVLGQVQGMQSTALCLAEPDVSETKPPATRPRGRPKKESVVAT